MAHFNQPPPKKAKTTEKEEIEAKWWSDNDLTLQKLWDHNLLGTVVEYLDFDTVGHMVVPAIVHNDLVTLDLLSKSAVRCHARNIMGAVICFKCAGALEFMLTKKDVKAVWYVNDAGREHWWKGFQMLYEAAAIAKDDVVHYDDSYLLEFYRYDEYEMLEYGLLNNMQIPQSWYDVHDAGHDLLEPTEHILANRINQAFHNRIEEEYALQRRIEEAESVYNEAEHDYLFRNLYSRTPEQQAAALAAFRDAARNLEALEQMRRL